MFCGGGWRTDKFIVNSEDGELECQTTDFHNWVGGDERFLVEVGRYHPYICHACPWVHHIAITRALKDLEDAISPSFVEPVRIDDGWGFSEGLPDPLYGKESLHDIYLYADDKFIGRVTIPVLWGKQCEAIVDNEPHETIRMLNEASNPLAKRDVDFNPDGYEGEVDRFVDKIYESVSNDVYRAGPVTIQEVHEEAVEELFNMLDHWDEVLDDQRLLAGDVAAEAGIAVFATLTRFDHAYHMHFKCNKKAIHEYDNPRNYTKEPYQLPGAAKTVSVGHTARYYLVSHGDINPKRIYSADLDLDFDTEHDRSRLPVDLPAALTVDD